MVDSQNGQVPIFDAGVDMVVGEGGELGACDSSKLQSSLSFDCVSRLAKQSGSETKADASSTTVLPGTGVTLGNVAERLVPLW